MVTKKLLEKYHSGLCTPEEEKQVEVWLTTGDEPLDLTPEKDDEKIKNQIWRNLIPTIYDDNVVGIPPYKRVIRYAASVIILFTVGFITYQYLGSVLGDGAEQAVALRTIETQRGEKRTVTLSDGSTVRMNNETKIKVPEKFEGDERVVYLTGHAHFDVFRDTERPFIIYTEDSKTKVLGTSFDINTKEDATEIIVTSGKVAFSEKDQEDNLVTLTANNRAVLNANKSITTTEVDALKLTAWKDNRLVFDNQPFSEVIKVVEPWYDIQITVQNPELLSKRYTFSYENPSLGLLLKRMSLVARFEYSIEGDKVIIK